jgi:cytochrome c peroxidase
MFSQINRAKSEGGLTRVAPLGVEAALSSERSANGAFARLFNKQDCHQSYYREECYETHVRSRTRGFWRATQAVIGLPADVWESLILKDNPMTAEKVSLGVKLYFDKRLSTDRTVSCGACHAPATALPRQQHTSASA